MTHASAKKNLIPVFATKIAQAYNSQTGKNEDYKLNEEGILHIDGYQFNIPTLMEICPISKDYEQDQCLSEVISSTLAHKEQSEDNEFIEIKDKILPRVRPTAWFTLQEKYMSEVTDDSDNINLPHQILNEDLSVGAVIDFGDQVRFINQGDIRKWRISNKRLVEVALQNLQSRKVAFRELAPEVWVSPWQSTDDAALMMHSEAIRKLKVNGDLIAFIPHRAYLLITGSEDIDGLRYVLEIVDNLMEDERALTSFAYIFSDKGWKVFEPRKDHPLYKEIKDKQAQSVKLYRDMLGEE